jgi:hypothetical protein
MATAGASAAGASSSGPISRPTAGVTPRTGKKLLTTFAIDDFRIEALGAHGEVGGRRAGEAGQDVVVVAEVQVALPGEAVDVGLARVLVEEFHQLLGIAHGQQAQHQRLDKAENSGIGADSEPEREERNGGESGRAPHHAQGVAKVLGEGWRVGLVRSRGLLGWGGQRLYLYWLTSIIVK